MSGRVPFLLRLENAASVNTPPTRLPVTGPPEPWKQSKYRRGDCRRENSPWNPGTPCPDLANPEGIPPKLRRDRPVSAPVSGVSPNKICHALVVDDQNERKRSGQLEVTLCAAHFNAFFQRRATIRARYGGNLDPHGQSYRFNAFD